MKSLIDGAIVRELKAHADDRGFFRELYVTSQIYNPDDEVRLKYNDPEINFDWLKSSTIK